MGKNYRKMLKFAPYMGENSRKYRDLLDKLKKPENSLKAQEIISSDLFYRGQKSNFERGS